MMHSSVARFLGTALLGVTLSLSAAESGYDRPMGPIGGLSRLTGGQNYVRVSSMPTNTAGFLAGLRVDDYIHGAFGEEFGVTQPGDGVYNGTGFHGAVQDLGLAIERAEEGDGRLPLKVMRNGVGDLVVTVILKGTNALGPAFPLNSPKYSEWYEIACSNLHVQLMNGNGNIGYYTPYAGLALMGHPGALQTNGPTPYRLSLNKIRDMVVPALSNCVYAPVEDALLDGTPNPNAKGGMSNWELGPRTMFLAEYLALTGDTNVTPTLQRAAEVCANCIQWWNQGLNYPTNHIWNAGHTGHGGVTGDYSSGSQGMNVTGLQMISGIALAARAGIDMTVRPRDGHYFGFSNCPPGAVMAGMENYDHSLHEKFLMHWDASAKSSGNYWGADEMWVGYCAGYGSAEESGTRTPATLFSIATYYPDTSVLDADRQERVRRLKNWVARHYWIQNNTHVCLQPGPMFQQMASAYLSPRQQRYYMDNWRFYYNHTRLAPGAPTPYFPGRGSSDAGCYLSNETGTLLNFAYALTVARGGLPNVPGYNTNQILAWVRTPFLTWPSEPAKYARVTNSVTPFVVDICDGLGTPLPTNTYTASWTFISGPAAPAFSNPNTASTAVTFPAPGRYRLQLAATRGTNSLTEPMDIDAAFGAAPAGFVLGYSGYEIYTGIGGNNVSDLTNNVKYPNYPDAVGTLTSLDATYRSDNYGQRIRGYIVPPATGSYRFFLASDDGSQMRLNPAGTNPAAAVVITSVAAASGQYVWNAGSASYTLTNGQPYFFEVLHKEGGGGDYVAVGWTGAGMTTTNVVPGSALAMAIPSTLARQPQSVATTLGASASFNVLVYGPGMNLYQWRLNGVPYWPATGESALSLANIGGGLAGNYDCVITTPYGMITSAVATLTISDAGNVLAGGLWREVYNGIGGNNVSDMTANIDYPRLSDSSGVLTNTESPSLGDNYGQRWTGWIKPPTNGIYRFYVASDDGCELWLSPDDSMAHKVKIASTGWANSRDWPNGGRSGLITLETGRRYYVEFLHKEGGGSDYAAFTWQLPGGGAPTNGAPPIDGAYLEYRTGGLYDDSYVAPPPLAQDDSFGVPANLASTLNVVANDLDLDPASLGLFRVSLPAHGAASASGRQTVAYMPVPGYSGADTFTYLVTNSLGLMATGTVNITVMSPTAGLRAWWKFDEAGGATVADSSGNNYTGGLTGGTRTGGMLNGAIAFDGNDYIAVPAAACSGLNSQISISLWHYGDPAQPVNTTTVYGADAANNRVINIHLPWSNGNVYWDCGNSGTASYDRINKGAAVPEYEGQWNHWVFTKNTATGEMKIYLNGVLWHSGAGLTRTLSAVTQLRIGADLAGVNGQVGRMDDVRIYDHELSLAEVQVLNAYRPVPGILLASPANNSVFPAPAAIPLAASVTNNGATLNRIQFFNGTNLLAEDLTAPYDFTWTNVPFGSYTLKARAVYNTSNTVDSPAATVAVGSPPTAMADAFTAYSGRATTNNLLANDLDADTNSLTLISVSAPAHGLVTIAGPRTVSYTSAAGYLGGDQFTYLVQNSIGLTAAGTATVSVVSVPACVWRGTNGSNWDFTTTNWSYLGAAALYTDGSPVRFDDTSTNGAVNVAAAVMPDSVTVSNTARAYTFTGLSIGGAGALLKSGTGTLTLNAANNFSGGTVISRGSIRAGHINALPGTVRLGDADTGGNAVALLYGSGSAPAPNIVVSNLGTGTVTLGTYGGGYATFTGSVNLNRPTILTDATGDRSTFGGIISGNPGTITITGTRVTFGNAANAFTATLVINAGSIYQSDHPTALPATTTVNNNGTYRLNNGGVHGINALNGPGGVNIIAGGAATLSLGNANGSGACSGAIVNNTAALSLLKNGTGTQALLGANTYTGTTTVSNGTLLVNGSLAAGSAVTVAGGALGGTGSIYGPTTIAVNGTLAPGANGLGTLALTNTLTLGGTVRMEIARNGAVLSNDRLNLATAVAYGGSLVVTNVSASPLAAGDRFPLFSAPNRSGSFTSITYPPLSPGLAWTNKLVLDGSIEVVQVVNTTPTNISFSLGGGLLTLTWPADHTGWRLVAQTNTLEVGLSPGGAWTTVPGSDATNRVVIPVDAARPSVFYRLVYP